MRMAHNAAMNIGRLREGRPLPGPPPLGEGTGRLPAGRGLGNPGFPICSPQTVMRMAHIAAMNIGRLREGRPLPGPPPLGEGTGRLPAGRGLGKPGFPICSPQTVMRIAHIAAMNIGRLREGRPLPGPPPLGEGTGRLPAGRGLGKPGFPVCSPKLHLNAPRAALRHSAPESTIRNLQSTI